MADESRSTASRSKALGIIAGALVAGAGVAIGLVGGLLGQRRAGRQR